jgi:hypothetical protein
LHGKEIFRLSEYTDWLWGLLFSGFEGGKGDVVDADLPPPSGAKVQNEWSCTLILLYNFFDCTQKTSPIEMNNFQNVPFNIIFHVYSLLVPHLV